MSYRRRNMPANKNTQQKKKFSNLLAILKKSFKGSRPIKKKTIGVKVSFKEKQN